MTKKYGNLFGTLAHQRALVGFLGEKSQCNWWDTNFLSPTGLQFLEINFPRSALAAGCNAVTEAAKRLHDELIGKGNVYHLFRFPSSVEEEIHRQLMTNSGHFTQDLVDKETALRKLKDLTSDSVDSPEGPKQIGTGKNLLSAFTIDELAKHYYDAFSNNKLCFPYFGS
jgi:hypothetical protein